MQKYFLSIAAFFGAFSVILGAFTVHSLKLNLAQEQLQIFETGVRYQFYHTFALIIVGILIEKKLNKILICSGMSFIVGIIFFSGSLYLLSVKTIIGIENTYWLGPITPLGGLFFIFGWFLLLFGILRKKDTPIK